MRFLFILFFTFNFLFSNDYKILSFDNHPIHGTLVKSNEMSPFLAIIIAGSGPTDRDGNNSFMKSNYLKILANELNKNGISSFRYDKRGVSKSLGDIKTPEEIQFSDYVDDAKSIINHFKDTKKFKKMRKEFYITTPIYYVNDKPHIGTAYTTILADVLSRFKHDSGHNTFFLTGLDEHGQKVQEAAEHKNVTAQRHCDEMAPRFINLWKRLHISNDDFIRTTEKRHKKIVQSILQLSLIHI